ncbi:c-type cytochrome [Nisaea sediminum]|uniref:c-type cytochrome n=1 Tax=Nisaea sediminum TaxID=2775867 RepID=UPI0018669A98|nr:cytochrome c family protein [Nisaea sediminum]
MLRNVAYAAAVLTLIASPAVASGDADQGKKVFNKCKACHVADKQKNRVGPHLVGIFGRKAGTVESFKYSKAMTEKGEEGLVWTEETMTEYLKSPKAYVKGTKMSFAGLKKEDDIENVIAYLKAETAK